MLYYFKDHEIQFLKNYRDSCGGLYNENFTIEIRNIIDKIITNGSIEQSELNDLINILSSKKLNINNSLDDNDCFDNNESIYSEWPEFKERNLNDKRIELLNFLNMISQALVIQQTKARYIKKKDRVKKNLKVLIQSRMI